MIRMLVSLYRGYGLGDAVQMSAVLRHLRKYRPDWEIHFQAEPGRESVGRGIAHHTFTYGAQPDVYYDREVQIILYDTFANWHDRPNTRVTSCLHEKFGLQWDRDCSQYQVNVPLEIQSVVAGRLRSVIRPVAIHYAGDSAKHKKDLSFEQAARICAKIRKLDCTPLLLDWRADELSLVDGVASVRSLGFDPVNGRDAAWQCGVIAKCEAFVGVDSGPSKCASATDTPTCVVWTGHHPAPFHDPAPNTTHLVPFGYHGLEPVCDDPGVIRFFEANYDVRRYADPVEEVGEWLLKTL